MPYSNDLEAFLNGKEKINTDVFFHTGKAKTMAVDRYDFLVSFRRQFQRELKLET